MDDYYDKSMSCFSNRRHIFKEEAVKFKDNEYDRINEELKDIAWRLYDLTCDFKELQLDTRQLCRTGSYNNYDKHKQFLKKLMKKACAANSGDLEDYAMKHCTERKRTNDLETTKAKYLDEFEEALECRRKQCLQEVEEDFLKQKNRFQRRCFDADDSDVEERLSSKELEQRLRDRLALLQEKTKQMCSSPPLRPKNVCEIAAQECCNKSKSSSRNNVICCRGKEGLFNQHSPHRVYLDGSKRYVVNHSDSKVIFVPTNIDDQEF